MTFSTKLVISFIVAASLQYVAWKVTDDSIIRVATFFITGIITMSALSSLFGEKE